MNAKGLPDDTQKPFKTLNRELSLLDFQARVLEEALDESNPLLERLKFLSIFGSNMDEFFMVRVSGIRKQVDAHLAELSPDGLTPREQLSLIRKRSLKLFKSAHQCFLGDVQPKLDKAGVHIVDYRKMTQSQRGKADEYFRNVVFPILTPLVIDPGHPFPHISNLSNNLAIVIKDKKGNEKFARLKVPATLPRMLPVKRTTTVDRKDGNVSRHQYFTWLDQVIAANLAMLFPGMEVVESHPFRIIRDADIEIQDIEAEDLIESMQQSIRQRKFGTVVMVAIRENMPARIRKLLVENLEIRNSDMYEVNGMAGMASLMQVYGNSDRLDLKYPAYKPVIPYPFRKVENASDMFTIIQQQNILLHHPYDSFEPVVDFLRAAARDPDVLAIKQILYRVGQNSPVVEALLEAAERGKQVAVLVELKARFDEESNITWAKVLERAGVHVVYGLMGLKTHSKTTLVVRRDGEGIRRYLHMATGNYNTVTANIYEDIGYFTCDEEMATDATNLFNFLTGYSTMEEYQKLLVAPVSLRSKLEALINREIKHAQEGRGGHLIFKVNSIVDNEMTRKLYEASEAGVKIDLIVRGMCCLVPGIENMSSNIRVISVVGRFLEHSRVFYFHNAGKEKVFLGSADLMTRNLSRRVETLFPVEDERHIRYLRDSVLETYLKDNTSARRMQTDATYTHIHAKEGEENVEVQEWMMKHPHGNDPEA